MISYSIWWWWNTRKERGDFNVQDSALWSFLFETSRLLNEISSVLIRFWAFKVCFSVDFKDLIDQDQWWQKTNPVIDFFTFLISNKTSQPLLLESALHLCVQSYNTSVINGKTETRELAFWTHLNITQDYVVEVPNDPAKYVMGYYSFRTMTAFLKKRSIRDQRRHPHLWIRCDWGPGWHASCGTLRWSSYDEFPERIGNEYDKYVSATLASILTYYWRCL